MKPLLLLIAAAAFAAETVEIRSSIDGRPQPASIYVPPSGKPAPLLVLLHSWSAHYNNSGKTEVALAEAERRGWAFVAPDFRGPNDHPEACGSDLAVQDVLDAVDFMKQRTHIDTRRIYVLGGSGGGYMTLVMAGRAPHLWAAASAWVPITDLAAWHAFSKAKNARYWKMMESCFDGPPTSTWTQQQYRRRSPLYFLTLARNLPIDIQTGIQDGHSGSVPVSHSLHAFNVLAAPADRISDADIDFITTQAKIPATAPATPKEERIHPILFRRASNRARVTVFDGGHETDFAAAIRWLEKHTGPEVSLHIPLQNDQVLARRNGQAVVQGPSIEGLQVSVNGGPFTPGYPTLKTGGPYALDFRVLRQGREVARARRTGILVGDLYLLAGQSNMVGRAPLEGVLTPDPRVHMLAAEDVWMVAKEPVHEQRTRPDKVQIGAGLGLSFARDMVRRTGVPVGLIPCARGGTSLEQWNPAHKPQLRRSLYGNLLARARLAGGPFKAMLWYQGEAEASSPKLAATYLERFEKLVGSFRADLAQPDLPVYFAQLSIHPVDPKPDMVVGWNLVREAQRQAAARIPNTGMVATLDFTLTDPIHLDGPSLQALGRRFAALASGQAPPRFESAQWVGPNRVRLHFSRPIKTQPMAQSFQLFNNAGLPVYGVFHAALDAKGDVLLDVAAVSGDVQLFYGYGLNPVASLPEVPAFSTALDSRSRPVDTK